MSNYEAIAKRLERQGEHRYPREGYEFEAARAIRSLTTQRDMLVKALEEIAEADWPGIPANHRLSKAREVARLALQTKEGV